MQSTARDRAGLIRKARRVFLSALAVGAAACVLAPGAALAGTLDQQQSTVNISGARAIDSSLSIAQTFTAGISGGLDGVDLYLSKSSTPSAPLTVEIRNVSGAGPGTTVLASLSIPAASVPTFPAAFVSSGFAAPAPLTAGTRYAIVAYSSTISYYEWGGGVDGTSPYAGGEGFYTPGSPPSGSWANDTADRTFRTYVTPVPTGQRAAALKKCKKKHSHKAKKKCKKKAKKLPV
jgi:hypothetical protein